MLYQGFDILTLLPFALIFSIFYFLVFRPQNQKQKDHESMIENLKTGNEVITNSGLIGKIVKGSKKEEEVLLEIADGVKVRYIKSMIAKTIK